MGIKRSQASFLLQRWGEEAQEAKTDAKQFQGSVSPPA